MKTLTLTALTGIFLLGSAFNGIGQTNKSLSNLTAPTAINQSLLPDTDNSKDLGNTSLAWRNLYFNNRLYLQDSIALHAPGPGNFFTGMSAGNSTLTGTYNTGLGSGALRNLTSGFYNTATGNNALANTTYAGSNSAFGAYTLNRNTTGRDNTAIGYIALELNTTGLYNTAGGSWALRSNTTGSNNTATGYSALWSNTTGSNNTAIGKYAMYSNSTGNSNVAIGVGALYKNPKGNKLVAVGDSALFNHLGISSDNVAVGSKALYTNTIGAANTALGFQALYSNLTASSNTAVGKSALYTNTEGSSNTALGNYALYKNTTGWSNTAVGFNALYANNTGTSNTSVGLYSLYKNSTGAANTALGINALRENATGVHNTAVGAEAGPGYNITGLYNSTAIGYDATTTASDQVRIGNTSVISIGGQVGWTTFSDGRYKKNVQENVPGLAFINSLRPVTYNVDIENLRAYLTNGKPEDEKATVATKAMDKQAAGKAGNILYNGFVAQEVEAAAKQLGYTFSGVDKPEKEDGLYGLRYDNFVVPLVKAVQELSEKIDKKDSLITLLVTRITKLEQANSVSSVNQKTMLTGAVLEQNIPNPFSATTTIRYTLPETFTAAQIIITNQQGQAIKQVTISGSGKGNLPVDAGSLAAGIYNYTLVVDGKTISTRKMIHTK